MNHLIELMELYPIQFQKQLDFSSNPNLTIECVLKHPFIGWQKYHALISNPSVSTPSNLANPKYQNIPWMSHKNALCSSAFSEKDVLENIHYYFVNGKINPLGYRLLERNGNLTPNFFTAIHQSWTDYWVYLGRNEHFVEKMCHHLANYPHFISDSRDFQNEFVRNRKLTFPLFTALSNKINISVRNNACFSEYITHNPNVSETDFKSSPFIMHNQWYDANVNSTIAILYRNYQNGHDFIMSTNPNLLFEDLCFLISNNTYEYRRLRICEYSSNHNLTWECVCDYSWSYWIWSLISRNWFTKSKTYYRETKLMRDLWDTFELEFNYLDLVDVM